MSKGRSTTRSYYNGYGSNNNTGRVEKLQLQRNDSTVVKLCDLHVYKVPTDLWRESYNNILNNVVTETISIGIIRVPAELRLCDVREEIIQQLQVDDFGPRDYVFLRSVGRSLTRLRGKQEFQLKVKHFLPPVAFAPELYILETTPEIRDALAIDDSRSSQSPPLSRRTSPGQRGYPNSQRNGYPGDSDTEKTNRSFRQAPASPVNKYNPLPQIEQDPYGGRRQSPQADRYDPYNNAYPPYTNTNNNDHYPYSNNQNTNQTNNLDTDQSFRPPPGAENPEEDWEEQPQPARAPPPAAAAARVVPPREAEEAPASPKSKPNDIRSPERGGHRDRRRDDDSGVAELSPDEERRYRPRDDYDNTSRSRDTMRRIEPEMLGFGRNEDSEPERLRRLEDVQRGNDIDNQRWEIEQEERRRQAVADRMREEEEDRRRAEEEDRLRREEHDRRNRGEEDERRRREEDERRRLDEEERLRRMADEEEERRREENRREDERLRSRREEEENENDRNRQESPVVVVQNTDQDRQRRLDEKNELLRSIEEARNARQEQEKEREELVKKAKQLQHKTTNRRNEARDLWKKKYFEEKKKTAPLEETSNKLRQDLDALHRRLMNTLEGPKEKNMKVIDMKPSPKSNYVIQCTKLQHEIEDLQRRVENARMKLTAEMKLRNQAQGELRALRAELTQRKANVDMMRQQQLAVLSAQPPPNYRGREERQQGLGQANMYRAPGPPRVLHPSIEGF